MLTDDVYFENMPSHLDTLNSLNFYDISHFGSECLIESNILISFSIYKLLLMTLWYFLIQSLLPYL